MRLLGTDELPDEPGERVFRESVLGRAALVAVVAAIGSGWLALSCFGGFYWVPALLLGLPLLAIAGWIVPGVLRGFTLDHWILRVREDGVALHLRSYLNDDPAGRGDPVVLWIPRDDIASAGKRIERLRVVDSDDLERTTTVVALELALRRPAPADLAQALQRELTRWPKGGRAGVHLVTAPSPDLLRVNWRSAYARVRQPVERALERIERLAPLHGTRTAEQASDAGLEDADLDGHVLALAVSGHRLEAMRLLRRRRGWGLAQAREHVERLHSGRSAA